MKIVELRLLACGPFIDVSLDLSGGRQGLHLIYGPNEAGKSSALRAITYLCFGFPIQLKDAFAGDYSALRVGAILRDERGEELDVVRRKGNKKTLRQRDDATPVDDEAMRHALGDIDEARFKQFFGIDHAMLVKGGKEIVEGGGNTGQILFSAGGASDLREILNGLEKDAEKLFAPAARNRELNQLFSKLADAKSALREHQLPARQWEEHHQSLERATKRKQTAEAALLEKTREMSRLERIRKALPLIANLTDARRKGVQLSEAPLLPADFRNRRQQAQENLRAAEAEQNRASAKADELQRQLADLAIPDVLLERRVEVEPLAERLGAFRSAQDDRPKREAEARQLEERAIEVLRKLGQDLDLTAADRLHLPESNRVRIRTLGEQYGGIVNDIANWTSKLEDLKPAIEENTAATARLPAIRDVDPLSTAVQETLELGKIDEELSSARQKCELSVEQLSIALKRLPLWSGTVDEIEALAVPLTETIDRFDNELADIDAAIKDSNRQLDKYQAEAGELNQKLEALRLEFDLPTEADLKASRQQRQQGWQLIRKALSAEEPSPDDIRAFVDTIGEGDDLADAFEHSVEASDTIADRLRREAERVATHSQLLAQQAECRRRIVLAAEQQQSAASRRKATLDEWNRLWQPVCCLPLTPREMLSWGRQHSDLVRQSRTVRDNRNRVKQLVGQVEQSRGRLVELLSACCSDTIPTNGTLGQLMAIAQRIITESASLSQRHQTLGEESVRLEKERKKAVDKLAAAEKKLNSWREEWSAAIAELPLDASGGPHEANAVLELLTQLNELQGRIRDKRERIAQIDGSAEQFTRDVGAIALQVDPRSKEMPVAALAANLGARLSKAIADDEKRMLLKRQLNDEQHNLAASRNSIEEMKSQLAALCLEAKCASADDLPGAERLSEERRSLEEQIQGLESRLREFSAGHALAAFTAEARSVDADAIDPQIRQLEDEIQRLDRELKDEIGPTIGAEQTELKKMDCTAEAADAAERIQDLILQIAVAAQEYARLQIALVTLRKGIERYRKLHQGPIIERSSELFSRLTLGAFSGLREDYDADGRPELVAVRAPDDRVVRVAEMSDGTADQLFLAVRLAWLAEYLETHPAVPFIVDDILIRFDDERSAATLQVLAELSARTQVILFTHHRHVVEIAQKTLDADTLFVHELPTAAVRLEA